MFDSWHRQLEVADLFFSTYVLSQKRAPGTSPGMYESITILATGIIQKALKVAKKDANGKTLREPSGVLQLGRFTLH
jgi:hypothetical protein